LKFGHTGEANVRKTAKACGFKLEKGNLPPFESCAIAKAKQKSVPGALDTRAMVPLERIGAEVIISLHRIRDGLNTCASKSLSSSRISSCRGVTKPPFFAIKGVLRLVTIVERN